MDKSNAEFSIDGKFRLRLDRWWEFGPRALVCMANPSTAGAHDDDATIRNLTALIKALGYPGFTVVNWLPYIATKPADLFRWRNGLAEHDGPLYRAVHAAALQAIDEVAHGAAIRFVAWGNLVPDVPHTTDVLRTLSCSRHFDLFAFGLTKDGSPKHPAARGVHRLVLGTPPVLWRGRDTVATHGREHGGMPFGGQSN
jgi:hypothetical protein